MTAAPHGHQCPGWPLCSWPADELRSTLADYEAIAARRPEGAGRSALLDIALTIRLELVQREKAGAT